jgi:hypothetical protein
MERLPHDLRILYVDGAKCCGKDLEETFVLGVLKAGVVA